MATKVALIGASCEATGHPTLCQEPAPGNLDDGDAVTGFTINGQPVATHGDSMHFDNHAHDYNDDDGCFSMSSHDLTPDTATGFTVNNKSVILKGDTAEDPGSGGTATVIEAGGSPTVTYSTGN